MNVSTMSLTFESADNAEKDTKIEIEIDVSVYIYVWVFALED